MSEGGREGERPRQRKKREIQLVIQTTKEAARPQSKSNMHCQTKQLQSQGKRLFCRVSECDRRREECVWLISSFGYSAVLPGTAVLQSVAPARSFLSGLLSDCRVPRPRRPPRPGAHNATTVTAQWVVSAAD